MTSTSPHERSRCPGPGLTVVVCTLGRSPLLEVSIRTLLEQSVEPERVLVIDNDPGSGLVRRRLAKLADDERIDILTSRRRGLSRARNDGVHHTRSPLVAFTDDDALATPTWVEQIVEVFRADRAERVTCVTGRVLPVGSDNESQRWFEQGFSFDKGTTPFAWRFPAEPDDDEIEHLRRALPGLERGPKGPVFPVAAGVFGSGNNMAFRTEWLRSVGGFDEVLGAGTPARGGEDLDAFRRVMLDGGLIVYQPSAVVEHHHRDNLDDLVAQSFSYGAGMAANVTRYAVTSPTATVRSLKGVPTAVSLLLRRDSTKNAPKSDDYPRQLDRAELRGYVAGPFLAILSALKVRRARRDVGSKSTRR